VGYTNVHDRTNAAIHNSIPKDTHALRTAFDRVNSNIIRYSLQLPVVVVFGTVAHH